MTLATEHNESRMAAPELRSPQTLELGRGNDGGLFLLRETGQIPVQVCRCFPWTNPSSFISLRDAKGNEVALVEDLDRMAPGSRNVLEDAVAEAGFLLEVTAIESIEEEVEIRNWRVMTVQGPRTFQTRLDEWPRETPSGGMLVRDVAEDLFHIPAPEQLDERSQELLWPFQD